MRVAIILLTSLLFLYLSGETPVFEQKIIEISQKSVAEDYFSAVSISVFKDGKKIANISEGFIHSKTPDQKITDKTLFDLASLTKPIVIVSLFFDLEKKGLLDRNWTVSKFFPEITREITLFQLLTHKSGLSAYADFFKLDGGTDLESRKKRIIKYISEIKKVHSDRYSDINYILLGFIIEKITGKDLDTSFKEFISKNYPSIKSFTYNPLKNGVILSNIVATSYSVPRNIVTCGEVEDENAAYLSGISGHAGLFSTADDVSQFYSLLLKDPVFRKVITDQAGFDKKESENSNFGTVADSKCSGHLGWSGTAFLICPENDIVITILTNRTHSIKYKPEDFTNIKAFRRIVFDLILSELNKVQ